MILRSARLSSGLTLALTGALRRGLLPAAAGFVVMALAAGAPAHAADNSAIVAKVDGIEIRESDVKLAEDELGAQLQQMDAATRRESIIAFLVDMKLVAKAAIAKKIGETEEFKKRLDFTRDRLLMDNLLTAEGKAAVTEEALKKVYEDAKKDITAEQEVRASHILVESEDEAKAVVAELKKGKAFADLAKEKSKDPGASNGGDLGFFTKDQMVPEFSAVAFTLEPGKVSDPVKSQFGWHVIKVEEKRNREAPKFDEVKGQLEAYVGRKAQADFVTKLREAAKVERLDKPAADAAKDAAKDAPAKAAPAKK